MALTAWLACVFILLTEVQDYGRALRAHIYINRMLKHRGWEDE